MKKNEYKKYERVYVTISLSPLVMTQIAAIRKDVYNDLVSRETLAGALVEWGIVHQRDNRPLVREALDALTSEFIPEE